MAVKKNVNPATLSLLGALKFVAPTQKKNGELPQQYCVITDNWMIASNGILTAACPVEETLIACPQTSLLQEALKRCNDDLVITQLDAQSISVRSGEFKALVPCVPFGQFDLKPLRPDPCCAALDDRIKAALECVAGLAVDSHAKAHCAAILLQSGSAVATNEAALLEYWHGIDLPPGLLIPKQAAAAICKTDKKLSGFGFSANSATFYFEDGSFYKTLLFDARFPAHQHLFPNVEYLWEVTDDFFKAIEKIAVFSQEGKLYFDGGIISTHEQESLASTCRFEHLPDGMGFNAKFLLQVRHAMKRAQFFKDRGEVVFFGENVRGILKGLNTKQKALPNVEEDDIPF